MALDLSRYTPADVEMLIQERACLMSGSIPWEERLRRARKEVEGPGEAEQMEMDLGREEFRKRIKELWSDY